MDYLLSLNADANAEVPSPGWIGATNTPLIRAIEQNNIVAVQKLLEHRADVNYNDARNFRALDVAISNYAPVQIIKTLLDAPGININYNIKFGNNPTPLMLAVAAIS